MVVWIRSGGREYRTPNIHVARLRFESAVVLVNHRLAWLTPDFLTLSSSTTEKPPGPGRHTILPSPVELLGEAVSGASLSLIDQVPSRAYRNLSICGPGFGSGI
jgi:hypothetical protein